MISAFASAITARSLLEEHHGLLVLIINIASDAPVHASFELLHDVVDARTGGLKTHDVLDLLRHSYCLLCSGTSRQVVCAHRMWDMVSSMNMCEYCRQRGCVFECLRRTARSCRTQ
jgi:hypothetical protein